MRMRHMSARTEEAYVAWIRRFIFFHGKRHPDKMGESEITAFLSHLAVNAHVAASTQNQALAALLFLYQRVLGRDLAWLANLVHAKVPERLPLVLSRGEVSAVLDRMAGVAALMATLLYGSGLRVLECAELRIKDLDFERRELTVRDGKGRKDRRTMLPDRLKTSLLAHLLVVRQIHENDLTQGAGFVALPDALDRKYPTASKTWPWQWSSQRVATTSIVPPARCVATTFTKPSSSGPSRSPSKPPESARTPPCIPCAIALPPTFWRAAMTFARSRNSSVTRTSGPR
jgi:integron integrase